MLTLYTTPLSANGRKPLAVLRHLGLEARVVHVDVYRGEGRTREYLAINPAGRIPTLVDGDLVLAESNAIIGYLAEAHGDFRLSSRDPKRRAEIAQWLFWEAAQWHPALVPVLAGHVGHLLLPATIGAPDGTVRWDDARLRAELAFLDAHLAGRPFVAGDAPTLADFAVAGMMTYARSVAFPFGMYRAIAAWYGRVEALDAWKATAAGPWAY
jgi:glutathione S-transferase